MTSQGSPSQAPSKSRSEDPSRNSVISTPSHPLDTINASFKRQDLHILAQWLKPKVCQAQGISAKVAQRQFRLHLLLEAEFPPNQKLWVTYFYRNIRRLKLAQATQFQYLRHLTIHGRSRENPSPVWTITLSLMSDAPSSPSPPPTPDAQTPDNSPGPTPIAGEELERANSALEEKARVAQSMTFPGETEEALVAQSFSTSEGVQDFPASDELVMPQPRTPARLADRSTPAQPQPTVAKLPRRNPTERSAAPIATLPTGAASPARASVPAIDLQVQSEKALDLTVPSRNLGLLARILLAVFGLVVLSYGGLAFGFIPQQVRRLRAVQVELLTVEELQPSNLAQLKALMEKFEELHDRLQQIPPLSGSVHREAQAQIKRLETQMLQVQQHLQREEQAQAHLQRAKRLAAQAGSLSQLPQPELLAGLSPVPGPTVDLDSYGLDLDSQALQNQALQNHWLAATYFLTLVPEHTFSTQEARQLLPIYRRSYWEAQALVELEAIKLQPSNYKFKI